MLAAALAALAAGCAPEAPPPNIILVSIDSLRPDHLGAYGYSRVTSPNIDRVASEGILFENASSVTTWTLPAHLTMLTGLHPNEHGVVDNGQALAKTIPLLPEVLAERGYQSAAIVSGPYLNARFGYARGWRSYDDSLVPAHDVGIATLEAASLQTSEAIHQRTTRLLDEMAPGPFFLFLHNFDVHYDYIPPPPWDKAFDTEYEGPVDGRVFEAGLLDAQGLPERDRQHLIALYDGEIVWVDHWIGILDRELSKRGLDRSTVLIITSDHGEEFFEHSRFGHRNNLFDSTLRIPLIVRLPSRRLAGSRGSTPVGLVDLAPTIAGLARARLPRGIPGRDLLRRSSSVFREPARSDLFASLLAREAAVIRDGWKLIARLGHDGRPLPSQVFLADLGRDPEESSNLALSQRRRAARLVIALREMFAEFESTRGRHPPESLATTPELERQLRALGYI